MSSVNLFFVATLKWGEQTFTARYKIVKHPKRGVAPKLVSITPPSSQEWCPPRNAWGMAEILKEQIFREYLNLGGPKEFVFDTQTIKQGQL